MKTRNFSPLMGTVSPWIFLMYLMFFSSHSIAGQIAEWTFENIPSAIPSLPIAASSSIPQVSASASLSGGNNNGSPDACSGNESWSSNFWHTGNSYSTSDYIQFKVKADPGEQIRVSHFSFSSNASSGNSALDFEVYYSKNNFTTTKFLFSGSQSTGGCSSHGGTLNTTILPGSTLAVRIYPYGQNRAAQAATIRIDNVSFSGALLPVHLSSFIAQATGSKVLLQWITESELNNDYFLVERSSDGIHFTALDRVYGHGTSQHSHTYQYQDNQAFHGTNYYRLRQVDFDGTETIHKIIQVNVFNEEKKASLQVWPTAVQTMINIQAPTKAKNASLFLLNMHGVLIRRIKWDSDVFTQQFDISNLPKGSYIIQFHSDQTMQHTRFSKL